MAAEKKAKERSERKKRDIMPLIKSTMENYPKEGTKDENWKRLSHSSSSAKKETDSGREKTECRAHVTELFSLDFVSFFLRRSSLF